MTQHKVLRARAARVAKRRARRRIMRPGGPGSSREGMPSFVKTILFVCNDYSEAASARAARMVSHEGLATMHRNLRHGYQAHMYKGVVYIGIDGEDTDHTLSIDYTPYYEYIKDWAEDEPVPSPSSYYQKVAESIADQVLEKFA